MVKKEKGPIMTTLDEFYKVGPGQSSSHTIGPMRITYDFHQRATKLPADGRDVMQCLVIPVPIDADRTVAAYEVRTGNRRVVHHASERDDMPGRCRIACSYSGGNASAASSTDTSRTVPRGSNGSANATRSRDSAMSPTRDARP